jgi:hypothetical protein
MRGLERVAAGLSLLAGLVHAWAGPEHAREWWAYGLFFAAAAAAQGVYGLILWTQGIEVRGGWPAVRVPVYAAGILGNVGIIAVWLVSRTVGVPIGPEAFETEPVGALDAASKTLELALVAVLGILWMGARSGR